MERKVVVDYNIYAGYPTIHRNAESKQQQFYCISDTKRTKNLQDLSGSKQPPAQRSNMRGGAAALRLCDEILNLANDEPGIFVHYSSC
ncbi:hypothetical protein GX50_02890 [[Emmonsia] crescens]|uniref:Uncharacterized protein n=1 Tax=[Emmonsia] crescens TaxID=73230 RepID=A0A2B7ZND7_9EURO|nr:hypothetical protein GX50_02890 [Emmonsia crescens]